MTESGLQATPFSPPELHPLVAHLGNVVYTRRGPWSLTLGDTEGILRPVLELIPCTTGCAVLLRCGEMLWQIRFGSDVLPRLHPALSAVSKDAPLPMELRQAFVEVLVTPLIDFARQLFDVPVSIEGILLDAAAESSVPQGDDALCLPLEWRPVFVQKQPETQPHWPVLPIFIDLPDRASAHLLLERLKTLPPRNILEDTAGATGRAVLGAVPVPLSVEAGHLRLTMRELAGLAPGDILLPDDYPAARGQLTLRFLPGEPPVRITGKIGATAALSGSVNAAAKVADTRSPGGYPLTVPTVACTVDGSRVTVTGFVPPLLFQETVMTDVDADPDYAQTTAQTSDCQQTSGEIPDYGQASGKIPDQPETGGDARPDVGDIEVLVHFELERRVMTVQDIATLAPGYTFALGCDAQSPVTLRVNGKPLGTGRLVDMNGVLGVQITRFDTV